MRRGAWWVVVLALALAGCGVPAGSAPPVRPDASASAGASASATPTGTAWDAPLTPSPGTASPADLVTWPDNSTVSHIFYHSLVVDPKRAFAKGNPDAPGILAYMVTIDEFTAQLAELYRRGYVLVHPQRLAAKGPDGVMRWTPLALPRGKKPLVLSVDDVSYNEVTVGNGFASKLVLAADGTVTNTYTDADGVAHTGAYDVPTVVDAFVAQHPDFSLGGDKGTIALTGYEGVLGYKSSPFVYGDTPQTRSEIAQATAVADAMKKAGWKFASHSYGHRDYGTITLDKLKSDNARWQADVAPIVGKTDMLIYAFGADIQKGVKRYTRANPRFAYLSDQGFDYFFTVDGSTPHWMQLQPDSLRMARINIDGITLWRAIDGRQKVLPLFFDAKAVVDPLRRLPTPGA